MEVGFWVSVVVLLIGIFATWYFTNKTLRFIGEKMSEAEKIIHEDIKHSQAKLERKIQKRS